MLNTADRQYPRGHRRHRGCRLRKTPPSFGVSRMESIYRVEGVTAETSAFAGGPWNPKLQHGAAPSSLICWAVEQLPSPVPMRVARLTVDLMRPVPVAPNTIETEVLREGRKIQLIAVRLLASGTEVVR